MIDEMMQVASQVIETARQMNSLGINVNKSGNVSVRFQFHSVSGFLITPTGIAYDLLEPGDIVFVPLAADSLADILSDRLPSSEWQMHAQIYRQNADIASIVHTHSACATALACQEMSIPPFHYMVAAAGGDHIPCVPYQPFGSMELAKVAASALSENIRACLLAHHGVIATGVDLNKALQLAVEVENLARCYLMVRQLGEPKLLDDRQMALVLKKFETYGKQK